MKISGIDKDFEDIIYYLDNNGFKSFGSCDGVEANHKNLNDLSTAYISFLRSPKIINLLAEFLKDKETFSVTLKSDDHFKPHILYGNTISGTTYNVRFSNRISENTKYFETIIRKIVKEQNALPSTEKTNLDMLEKVLEENSNSDLAFEVTFNGFYKPRMKKDEKINLLTITTKSGEGKVEGNVEIQNTRDMETLALILADKYNLTKLPHNAKEYPQNEFIMTECDNCSCFIYFTDEYLSEIFEIIQYSTNISHTLPVFESREWIGSDEDFLSEYNAQLAAEFDISTSSLTPLQKREAKLKKLEKNSEKLLNIYSEIKEKSTERTDE